MNSPPTARWRIFLSEHKATIIAPLIVAVVAGVLVPVLGNALGSERKRARLEIVDLSVAGGTKSTLVNERDVLQTIDILVRNTGDTVSVLSGVQLEVLDYSEIVVCEAGGGLQSSAHYNVVLPLNPQLGEVVDVPISQEVAPDAADRFTLTLGLPPQQLGSGASHLYHLRVLVQHDNEGTAVEAGLVVAAGAFIPDSQFFDQQYVAEQVGNDDPVADCYASNEQKFRHMVALPGARSPDLTERLIGGEPSSAEPAPASQPPGQLGVQVVPSEGLPGTEVDLVAQLSSADGNCKYGTVSASLTSGDGEALQLGQPPSDAKYFELATAIPPSTPSGPAAFEVSCIYEDGRRASGQVPFTVLQR